MKIKIIKYGPIENAEIEFAPMLVFTGDSNLGKSYINYLMYYVLYSITKKDELKSFIAQKRKGKEVFELSIKSVEKWLESRAEPFMQTFLNSEELKCQIQIDLLPSSTEKIYQIQTSYSDFTNKGSKSTDNIFELDKFSSFTIAIDGKEKNYLFPHLLSNDLKGSDDLKDELITDNVAEKLQNDIFGQLIESVLILPPARGAFVGENYTMKDKISSSVGMYNMFLKDYDKATQPNLRVKLRQRKTTFKYNEEIERLLNGKLYSKEGRQYLKLKNGQDIPLSASASSIKELSPLLFVLQTYPNNKRSFCIEEPEAHLHPQMQINVTDLIAHCFSDGMMFQFTTHSDYVIQRINQLIKLYYIRENNNEIFKTICEKYHFDERHCINPDKIKMYYFSLNNEGKVIIEQLNVTDKGIPMVTFFEVVKYISSVEDDLDIAIDEIKESKSNENE